VASLTLRQIKSAIEDKIETAFPGVKVHKTGVQTNFERPSFFVLMANIGSNEQLYNRTRSMNVDIHFFPTDRYQHTLEILDTQDALEATFGLNLAIQDRIITLDSEAADVVDGVLHFPFSFTFLEDQPQVAPGDLMQEMDYNG
jgi:hypothetical protein